MQVKFDLLDDVFDVTAVGAADVDDPVVRVTFDGRMASKRRSVTEFKADLNRLRAKNKNKIKVFFFSGYNTTFPVFLLQLWIIIRYTF